MTPDRDAQRKEHEDKVFIETRMYHGRASRSPLARLLNTFGVAALCLAGGLHLGITRLVGDRVESSESRWTALFIAAVLVGLGVWSTVSSVRTYRKDRALAQRRTAPRP